MSMRQMRCQATVPSVNGDGSLQCSLLMLHSGGHHHTIWRSPFPTFDEGFQIDWKQETPYIASAWWPCPPDEYDRRSKAARGECA